MQREFNRSAGVVVESNIHFCNERNDVFERCCHDVDNFCDTLVLAQVKTSFELASAESTQTLKL